MPPRPNRSPVAICTPPPNTVGTWRGCSLNGHCWKLARGRGACSERNPPRHFGRSKRQAALGPGAGAPIAGGLAARRPAPHRHARGLRARHLRRVLGDARRGAREGLPHVRGAGARPPRHHRRGSRETRRLDERAAGQLLRGARSAVRLLHAGNAHRRARTAEHESGFDRGTEPRCDRRELVSLHWLPADRRGGAARHRADESKMSVPEESRYRYIGAKRRAKEHPRFVAGLGRYVADIALPGMKHVALVASPHAAARIVSIDTQAATAAPGVLYVLTGEEFCASTESLAIGASIQVPKFPDQTARALRLPGNAVRVHYDVDVGGSYGVKRGIKHTVLVGYLAKNLGVAVRLIEDRLENLRGGDMQGPDRIFDMQLAFDADGAIRAMKIRAVDDVGAYAGRSPFQLGKPVTAICGPYAIDAIEYEPTSVMTNKTPQEAVRGFGQSPTNFAIERAIDRVARHLGMDGIELRKRNFIRKDQFPYTIASGSTYDSGDYHTVLDETLAAIDYASLVGARDEARRSGRLAGIGISSCLEPSGGNSAFEVLMNPKNENTTWMDSCLVRVDLSGSVTGVINNSSAGQGHESLVSTVVGEILERDPATIRVVRADSLTALPSNSPVGSRMAIMLGGAAAGAAKQIKETLVAIAAHNRSEERRVG